MCGLLPDAVKWAYLSLTVGSRHLQVIVDGLWEDEIGHRHGALRGEDLHRRLVDEDIKFHLVARYFQRSSHRGDGEGAVEVGLSACRCAVSGERTVGGVDVEVCPEQI